MQAGHRAIGLEVQLIEQEVIGVLHLQADVTDGLHWEVTKVRGHDHIRPTTQGGGHLVAVVGVREFDSGPQRLPACDASVVERGLHRVGASACSARD